MPINHYGIMDRITEDEEKELLDDEILTFQENAIKEMRLPRRQKHVVHELRRLNANIVDASVINADDTTTFNVHQKLNAHLANVENDFTCTLVVCDNKMLLVNESHGVKRQCTKGPKKYVNFYDTRENVASVVSPSLEGEEMMVAAPAAPSPTVIDTDQQQYFCGEDSSEGQPVVIDVDEWDRTFSAAEVDSSSHDSFEFESDAVNEDTSEIEQDLDQKQLLIFIPMPREGFVGLCQWKYFLAAFHSDNIYVWVVEMETKVFMAVTNYNVSPSVYEAIGVVNIRNAINEDELPLLAVQLLRSAWQNADANPHVVAMRAMEGYWQIIPLKGNLRHIARSQISPFLLVNVEQVGVMLPTSTVEHLPMPEEPPPYFADSSSEPEPKSQVPFLISLDAAISVSPIRDQYLKLTPKKKKDIGEELLSTVEVFSSDEEELLQRIEKPRAKNVNMDNQDPVEAVASPLSLPQDVFAKEFLEDDKPVITSIEYLKPLAQLTENLLDTNSSVHPPPAKSSRFSNTDSLEELLNGDDILISKVDNNTNQNKLSIGNEGAGTGSLLKYPAIPITKVTAAVIPREVWKIYPNAHMPVDSQLKPVTTTTIPAKVTCVRLDKDAASALASVPENRKNLPIFGFVSANGFTRLPAKVFPESTNIIVKISDVVESLFKSIEEANRFLNNHFATNPEFSRLLPAEWKFSIWK